MGQKVHPKGLRLGSTQQWDSRWMFSSKKAYRDGILSDVKIRKGILDKFKFAAVTQIEIERAINKITVVIHSAKPGMLIGRGGKGIEEVKNFIVAMLGKNKVEKDKIKIDLKVEPVKKPYLNAYYVAFDIAGKIVRHLPHRVVIHQTMDKVLEAGAKGVKIQLGGRINGATISRREKYYQGTIPTSTIKEDVDFARFPALTKSGYVGVKVWISR